MAAFVFWTAYVMLFVAGGFLALYGVPLRLAYASVLPLLLIPIGGLVVNRVALSMGLFVLAVMASALLNGSSLTQAFLFLRFILTPYMMFYLVQVYVTRQSIVTVLRVSLALGLIQVPVVLIQRLFYDQMMAHAALDIGPVDANVGTFFVSDDPAMCFFVTGLILFLLFDDENNGFVRHRQAKAAWLTIAILLAYSVMSQLVVAGIWAYYAFRRFSVKNLVRLGLAGALGLVILVESGYLAGWKAILVPTVATVVSSQAQDPKVFLMGQYSRKAAVEYYLSQPLKVLGDGPSRYYNAVTQTYTLGNTGQIFTMYAEAGLVGLFLSFWIMWTMGMRGAGRPREARLLSFGALTGLAITSSVMTDASIMLAYCVFSRTDLVSLQGRPKDSASPTAPSPAPELAPA